MRSTKVAGIDKMLDLMRTEGRSNDPQPNLLKRSRIS